MKKIFTLIAAAVAMTASAQDWKAAAGGSYAQGSNLVNNSFAQITVGVQSGSSVQIVDDSQAAAPKTFCGMTCNYYVGLRTDGSPSATNPEGVAKDANISVVVKCLANVDVTVYGKNGKTKTLQAYDQTSDEMVANTQITDGALDDGDYTWTGFTFKFQKDHTYTIFENGGTFQMTALKTAAGTYVEPSNKVYGYMTNANAVTYGDGATMAITGNTAKTFGSGSSINGTTSIKNSNGAEMTFTAATGKNIKSVDFYAVTNDASTSGVLATINDETINSTVESLKDFTNPTKYSYTFTSATSSFRFKYGTKQVYFILDVTYGDAPTAVAEVAAEAQAAPAKFVKNGQVVIAKGDKLFNVAGAQVK